jgi:hypothetical protein
MLLELRESTETRRCVLEEFIDDVYKQAPAIGLPWFRNMSWWSSTFFPLSVSDFVGIAELSFLARLDSGK